MNFHYKNIFIIIISYFIITISGDTVLQSCNSIDSLDVNCNNENNILEHQINIKEFEKDTEDLVVEEEKSSISSNKEINDNESDEDDNIEFVHTIAEVIPLNNDNKEGSTEYDANNHKETHEEDDFVNKKYPEELPNSNDISGSDKNNINNTNNTINNTIDININNDNNIKDNNIKDSNINDINKQDSIIKDTVVSNDTKDLIHPNIENSNTLAIIEQQKQQLTADVQHQMENIEYKSKPLYMDKTIEDSSSMSTSLSNNNNTNNNNTKSIINTLSNMSLIYNSTLDSIDFDSSYSSTFIDSNSNDLLQPGQDILVETNNSNPPVPYDRRISNNPFISDIATNHTNIIVSKDQDADDNNPFNI